MTPQELKNSILQLAIEGRLVEQREEEDTAEELYAQIQAEKAKLIAEGKLKKQKALPEITEEEKPFEIPKSWKWVRLGEVTTYANTKDKVNPSDISPETWSLDLEDIEKESGKILRRCLAKERRIKGDKVKFYAQQILYSKLRPYLKKILVVEDEGVCSSEIVPFYAHGNIVPNFIVAYLKSPYVDVKINSVTYGVKMPRVGTDTMINLLIPLPPLAEQHRIVAKIEELMPHIERYEKAWSRLEDFNKRFPSDMQKSLLQYAIEGRLVEQREEEGTAEELYAQIQAEKAKRIAEGKLKKQKTLPEITEAEKPFEIPASWKWVRWGDISLSIQYGYNASGKNKGTIKMVRISDIQDNTIIWSNVPWCDIAEADIETYLLKENDILFARTGGTVGKSYLVKNISEKAIYAGYLIRTRYSNNLSSQYLKFFMESSLYWKQLRKGTIATAQPNCNGKVLSSMIIPLPPLAEQHRIVARLEELLPLCNGLKK